MSFLVFLGLLFINYWYGRLIYEKTGFGIYDWQWWLVFLIGCGLEIYACGIAAYWIRSRNDKK